MSPTSDSAWKERETAALLRILELGEAEIAAGHFQDAEAFFAELERSDSEEAGNQAR